MKANDLYQEITNKLIADIESGAVGKWHMPWHTFGGPKSADGRPYRGVNSLWLAMVANEKRWTSLTYGTYKAWQAKDIQVAKGEKATKVIFWQQIQKEDESTFMFAKTYSVFAAEQCVGAEDFVKPKERDTPERIAHAEDFFANIPARVSEGGNRAYFDPSSDEIRLPECHQFKKPSSYYATRAHESVHWTGHESRLNRTFGQKFGDEAYAAEELVAELGSAMLCAQLGITSDTREDHASYLQSWLKVLKSDARALITFASRAQAAVDELNKYQEETQCTH